MMEAIVELYVTLYSYSASPYQGSKWVPTGKLLGVSWQKAGGDLQRTSLPNKGAVINTAGHQFMLQKLLHSFRRADTGKLSSFV